MSQTLNADAGGTSGPIDSMGATLTYTTIEVEQRGHTACITLNRPEVLNAINDEMIA
jgi:hypothetical protein